MLSGISFIQQSLELHLFFARIMKEHSFFLEAGFTQKNSRFIDEADSFRMAFDRFLADVVSLSNGVVRPNVLKSGEVITPFTLKAEMVSSYFTGINIATGLTKAEEGLKGNNIKGDSNVLERRVYMLNERSKDLVKSLIQFKAILCNF